MTLLELKMKKQELRNQMDAERKINGYIEEETFIEYNEVIRELGWVESILLKPIVISLLLLMLLIGSCQTVDGFRRDLHKLTEPPIQTQEK